MLLEILRNEPPVTMVWFVFAAKEAATGDQIFRDNCLDSTMSH
jgi:hypothetical protein